MPARAGILRERTPGTAAAALGFRSATAVRCVGDGCGFRAHAASADSSPERDHSAGSLSSAGWGRDTGGLPRSNLRRLPCAPQSDFRIDLNHEIHISLEKLERLWGTLFAYTVTNNDWFRFPSERKPDEVNFW